MLFFQYIVGASSEIGEGEIKEVYFVEKKQKMGILMQFFIGAQKDIPIIVVRFKGRLFALSKK